MIFLSLEVVDLNKLARLISKDIKLEVLGVDPIDGIKLKLLDGGLLRLFSFRVLPSLSEDGKRVILELKNLKILNNIGRCFSCDIATMAEKKSKGMLKRISPSQVSVAPAELGRIFNMPITISIDSLQIKINSISLGFELE